MATFTKEKASASTGGKNIAIAATATPGTALHTTGTSSTTIDEVTLELCNTANAARLVTLEWGGTTSADNVKLSLDPYEIRVFTGILMGDGTTGRTVAAFADVSGVNAHIWVNRIAA
jgi:hypothetical protein